MIPFIEHIFTRAQDRQSQKYGMQLNEQTNKVTTNIDASNARQAEIEMQKAAAMGARSDIGLDQWNTVVGSGTSTEDYFQKYFQGQANRDFQNPNALSPNNILFAVLGMVALFVLVMIMMMKKTKTTANLKVE